jgi:hypothetical protein
MRRMLPAFFALTALLSFVAPAEAQNPCLYQTQRCEEAKIVATQCDPHDYGCFIARRSSNEICREASSTCLGPAQETAPVGEGVTMSTPFGTSIERLQGPGAGKR